MANVAALTKANTARFSKAQITRGPEFTPVARRLAAAKNRYQPIEAKTGVPWFVIAVIHEREASQRWDRSIAQGDRWDRKSVNVPKGRGPFASFEDAAIDALVNCAPYAARWKDWSPGGTMTLLEQYNGLGYAAKGVPSPYIWSGTDQYRSGKYVRDHVYDPNTVDRQLGCAGLILAMQAIDASIRFGPVAGAAPVKPAASTATKTGAGVAAGGVVATVAVGAQQGWGPMHWIVAACIGAGFAAALFFIRKAVKSS